MPPAFLGGRITFVRGMPFYEAVQRKNLGTVKLLFERGANPQKLCAEGSGDSSLAGLATTRKGHREV
jgi:hypothetical protein